MFREYIRNLLIRPAPVPATLKLDEYVEGKRERGWSRHVEELWNGPFFASNLKRQLLLRHGRAISHISEPGEEWSSLVPVGY